MSHIPEYGEGRGTKTSSVLYDVSGYGRGPRRLIPRRLVLRGWSPEGWSREAGDRRLVPGGWSLGDWCREAGPGRLMTGGWCQEADAQEADPGRLVPGKLVPRRLVFCCYIQGDSAFELCSLHGPMWCGGLWG